MTEKLIGVVGSAGMATPAAVPAAVAVAAPPAGGRPGPQATATTLAGCVPQTGQPGSTAAAGASAEPLTLPIVKQPLSLSYWAPMSSNVSPTMKSFGEIACYRELEKRTGIHIDFQHPPLGQET